MHLSVHDINTNTRGTYLPINKGKHTTLPSLPCTYAHPHALHFPASGWTVTPEVSILRAVFWIAYMVGVVVVAAYSATLVSFLTVQGNDLPFDSLDDIQRIGKHRLGILKGSVLEEFFKVKSRVFSLLFWIFLV